MTKPYDARSLLDLAADLPVPHGAGEGESFTVLPWQRRFLKGAFAPGVRSAALSVARGNGKSTLAAVLACAVLMGWAGRKAQCLVVASSFMRGRGAIFEAVLEMLHPVLADSTRWRVWDSTANARIIDQVTGCELRVLGADPRRAHGLRPALIIADEAAQWSVGQRDAMLAALETARGKVPGSRMVWIGTRPANEDHPFAKALAGGVDFALSYAASPDAPIDKVATWRKANPSLDHMPELKAAIRAEAASAKGDERALAAFRSLRLNLGTADTMQSLLLAAGEWKRAEAPDVRDTGGPYCLGVDLGGGAAMSAFACYRPLSGFLDVFAVFPSIPSLGERGNTDGVGELYNQMAARGELHVSGANAIDLPAAIRECVHRWGAPDAVAADRWRRVELVDSLVASDIPPGELVLRGQGYKDGAEDVRDFRRAVLEGRVHARPSLLLRSALSEARVVSDPSRNEKLAKMSEGGRHQRARDDAAAAAILAVAVGERWRRADGAPVGLS